MNIKKSFNKILNYFKSDTISINTLSDTIIIQSPYENLKHTIKYNSLLLATLLAISVNSLSRNTVKQDFTSSNYTAVKDINKDSVSPGISSSILSPILSSISPILSHIPTNIDATSFTHSATSSIDVAKSERAKLNALSLEDKIKFYSEVSYGTFNDNYFFKTLREYDALNLISKDVLEKKDVDKSTNILLINKTFQKAIIINFNEDYYIQLKDSSYDNDTDIGRLNKDKVNHKFYAIKNSGNLILEKRLNPYLSSEFDCSTAKIYGDKVHDGDGRTPEGIFSISEISDSHDWVHEGKKVYGPNFFRVYDAIGIHGNGTDTLSNRNWRSDKRYKEPDSVGIFNNNFGYGKSLGCIRFNNEDLRKLIRRNALNEKTIVLIYEDKNLTNLMRKYYPNNR